MLSWDINIHILIINYWLGLQLPFFLIQFYINNDRHVYLVSSFHFHLYSFNCYVLKNFTSGGWKSFDIWRVSVFVVLTASSVQIFIPTKVLQQHILMSYVVNKITCFTLLLFIISFIYSPPLYLTILIEIKFVYWLWSMFLYF